MSIIRTMAVAVAAASGMAFAGTALAQGNCDWYAKTALAQQKENVDKKCGFQGDGWSSNYASHRGWCNSVSPDVWRKAAKDRADALGKCQPK